MRQDNPPVARTELDMTYMTNRVNHNTMMNSGMMMDDDMEGSSTGESTRDKGRGSYKCGRCGVPKKGHVCPYQPKLKRRPDEPTPDTRNAAIQVEMDEVSEAASCLMASVFPHFSPKPSPVLSL
jgi:hypothetical protein